MHEEAWRAQRLRHGCELVRECLASLQRMDSPSLWRGPAARVFREELAELAGVVWPALGAASAAADVLEVAAAAGGGG
jgi:hypothetical protein